MYSLGKPKFKTTRDDKAPSCSTRRHEHRDNLETWVLVPASGDELKINRRIKTLPSPLKIKCKQKTNKYKK